MDQGVSCLGMSPQPRCSKTGQGFVGEWTGRSIITSSPGLRHDIPGGRDHTLIAREMVRRGMLKANADHKPQTSSSCQRWVVTTPP